MDQPTELYSTLTRPTTLSTHAVIPRKTVNYTCLLAIGSSRRLFTLEPGSSMASFLEAPLHRPARSGESAHQRPDASDHNDPMAAPVVFKKSIEARLIDAEHTSSSIPCLSINHHLSFHHGDPPSGHARQARGALHRPRGAHPLPPQLRRL